MNYKIRIKSPNKIFTIKNRPIRTPFETVVTENGLESIKARISFYGLSKQDYEIRSMDTYREIDSTDKKNEYSQIPPKEQNIEKSETKRTITENITKPKEESKESESKSSSKFQNKKSIIKQKIIDNTPKTSYQKQQPQELSTDSKTSSEQNINTNIEVSVEELTDKSTSLLEKFLKSEF